VLGPRKAAMGGIHGTERHSGKAVVAGNGEALAALEPREGAMGGIHGTERHSGKAVVQIIAPVTCPEVEALEEEDNSRWRLKAGGLICWGRTYGGVMSFVIVTFDR